MREIINFSHVTPSPGPAALRLIIDPQQPGAHNMAVDATLLRSAAQSPATLRLYGFAPACLSLGRFQPLSDISEQAVADRRIDVVRRPTGGKAVLHDHEVTYSLVLGRDQLTPFTKRGAYRVGAELLLALLQALGVSAQTDMGVDAPARSADADCFRTTTSFEIVASGRKLVGSAQTTTRDGSLQHGSIPLSGSYRSIDGLLAPPAAIRQPTHTNVPTSVAEETGTDWGFRAARDALANRLAQGSVAAWITTVRFDTLTSEESEAAARLTKERFATTAWTERSHASTDVIHSQ